MEEAQPISFGGRITALAEQRPDDTAMIFAPREGAERTYSWAELERRSVQVAHLLDERGVGQESMLVVAVPNSPEHFFASLAGWKLGACVLPLRWDLPDWERDRLIEVAKPAVVVAEWSDAPAPLASLADIEATQAREPSPLEDRVPDPARAIASSGSTGRPKLIVKAGRGEAVPGYQEGKVYPEQEGVFIELIPAPLYHTNGFTVGHNALFNGDCILLMGRFDAAQLVDLIQRHRVQRVTMVPTMLMRVARLPDVRQRDFSSLVAVLQGGAPCPPWLVHAWIDLVGPERFIMSYGSTENIGLSTISGAEWLEHPGSVGTGVDTEFRILDESGRELPRGEIGEIFMRSTDEDAEKGFEYVGAPPAKTTDDGFTSIGDMGWLDEDGYVYIADRRADMVVSGGANVFPAEVEAALLEHPGLIDACVIGVPDEQWGQRVHAIFQARDPDDAPSSDVLRAHCKARLASYKVPKTFERVDALPRSDAGKLNRSALVRERAGQ